LIENSNKMQEWCLFDLRFFIYHVLANDGIKLFDFHFIGHGTFIFGCCVKMTSAS